MRICCFGQNPVPSSSFFSLFFKSLCKRHLLSLPGTHIVLKATVTQATHQVEYFSVFTSFIHKNLYIYIYI